MAARIAQNFVQLGRRLHLPAGDVVFPDRQPSGVEGKSEPLLAVPEGLLGAMPVRPVPEAHAETVVQRKQVELDAPVGDAHIRILERRRLAARHRLFEAGFEGGGRGPGKDLPDHATQHAAASAAVVSFRSAVDERVPPFAVDGIESLAQAVEQPRQSLIENRGLPLASQSGAQSLFRASVGPCGGQPLQEFLQTWFSKESGRSTIHAVG